jgi:thiol-disulfide isomerase/thioredoxin
MKRQAQIWVIGLVLLLGVTSRPAWSTDSSVAAGRAALERSVAAYRSAGPFREVLDFELLLPDGSRQTKAMEYGVGAGGEAFFNLLSPSGEPVFRILAKGDRVSATQFNVADRYAEAPYAGDFAASLLALGGSQAGISAPPPLAARSTGSVAEFVEALRYAVLGPLEIVGSRPLVKEDGEDLVEILLEADNGNCRLRLDAKTHFLRELALVAGTGDQRFEAEGSVETELLDAAGGAIALDLSGRSAVATIADLAVSAYPLGEQAPDFALRTLDDRQVTVKDLLGSVVVLDFWATWCVPCWTTLEHLEELDHWVGESGLPIEIYAVNTLERATTVEEQRAAVEAFLHSKQLEIPTLLDVDDRVFSAFHSPGLPSLVILDPEGTLAHYHSGVLPDMVETIKGQCQALLE